MHFWPDMHSKKTIKIPKIKNEGNELGFIPILLWKKKGQNFLVVQEQCCARGG
jgi:hypothetical protein